MLAKTNVVLIEFICTKYVTRLHIFAKLFRQYVYINKLLLYSKLFHLLRGIRCHITATDEYSIEYFASMNYMLKLCRNNR